MTENRVWIETENGETDHVYHVHCAPHINDTGRIEDGSSQYGWPWLECAGCGTPLRPTLRNGRPAINIKCHPEFPDTLLRTASEDNGYDPEDFIAYWQENVADNYEMLSDYQGYVCEQAFEDATEDAAVIYQHPVSLWQEGRSGGWLVVDDLPDPDFWTEDDLARWTRFATCVQFYVDDTPYAIATLIAINAYDRHLTALDASARWQETGRWQHAFQGTPLSGYPI